MGQINNKTFKISVFWGHGYKSKVEIGDWEQYGQNKHIILCAEAVVIQGESFDH